MSPARILLLLVLLFSSLAAGLPAMAQVQNQRRGSASLRVSATDAAGHSVVQTVIDAYAVG